MFFRTVAVLDVSMTDPLPGKQPVPLTPPAEPITGDSHHHLIARLIAHAAQLGYTVEIRELPEHGPGGWCDASAARSLSPTDLATSRSAPSPTNWPTHTGSDASSTQELRPRSSSTPSLSGAEARTAAWPLGAGSVTPVTHVGFAVPSVPVSECRRVGGE